MCISAQATETYYTEKRHETDGRPKGIALPDPPRDWAIRDKIKTVSAALVVCLNLGVDPPDVVRPVPSAVKECWIDPAQQSTSNNKVLEMIGKNLQNQFESLSLKTRYKQYLDPSIEETRKFCSQLRRNAKDERVLFYYNGHGVPRPTISGEIWVFNRDYTQYIPVALYDLQTWLGGPALCIYDCSHAENVVANYERFVGKHEDENREIRSRDPHAQLQNYGHNIHLAACGKIEQLPTHPELPADMFTCCLTTPIDMSILFHILQNPLHHDIQPDDVKNVPGAASERRSPKGELNWILTAITDTIAWNALSAESFGKLFRQDLMVAALFRNYLVADRIMRAYGCHPVTIPAIPSTHDHPLWEAWDLAVEMVVAQLPALKASQKGGEPYEYQTSNFFAEQLKAFDMYLAQGAPNEELPTQLPVVLQVLLSQAHRLRALVLLSKFLDVGPWAVNFALTIGIFPYVVKLLQSPAIELKPIMIFIWARIIAVAPRSSVHGDLIRDNHFSYFTNLLIPGNPIPLPNILEHKAMCAFVMAIFCSESEQARYVCLSANLMESCLEHLQNKDHDLLRKWCCICISMLWKDYTDGKWVGIRCNAHHRICALITDEDPEVRTAAINALTNFLGIPDLTESVAQDEEMVASTLMVMTTDGSSMVRRELIVFFSAFVKRYRNKFLVTAYETLVDERAHLMETAAGISGELPRKANGSFSNSSVSEDSNDRVSENTIQGAMWYQLILLSVDPHPEVAQSASMVVDWVHNALLESPLAKNVQRLVDSILDLSQQKAPISRAPSVAPMSRQPTPTVNGNPAPPRNESYLLAGLRRTASVASALKYFVGGSESTDNLSALNGGSSKRPSGPPGRPGVPAEWSNPPDQNDPTKASTKYLKAQVAKPKQFKERSGRRVEDLPLSSVFVKYATQYFLQPQMKARESEEPGSDDYNERLWRRDRNERILDMTQPLKTQAGSTHWDKDAGVFNNASQPSKLSFHQFEDTMAVADDRDTICVWNWRNRTRLSRFSNGNPKGSKINEARFINEDDSALLISGSSDGVVRIFRNYDREVELVTAYRALTEMVPSTRNAGLVFDWQQMKGRLLVAGDAKVIRVWDATMEYCINDIPARSGSCITSLTSDRVQGDIFAAGYGDGAVRVFDQRLKPAQSQVRVWREHKQWITNVHMQRGGQRELVSGSRNGEVRMWDIRMEASVGEVRAPGVMRTLGVHEHAPVFAT